MKLSTSQLILCLCWLTSVSLMARETPEGIDAALLKTQEVVASPHLADDTGRETRIKLDLARRQREQHDFVQAIKTLAAILDSEAAEEAKSTALLELALTAQEQGETGRALQVFAQYVKLHPDDPSVPEVMLRQGLLYRNSGATQMALSKFYAVMTAILNRKLDATGYYQRLVLQAQTEIAETYYLQGKFAEAADFFERLLKLNAPELNQDEIQIKLLRSLSRLDNQAVTVAHAESWLAQSGASASQPEVRLLLATALRRLGRVPDALRQISLLLESKCDASWKHRAGNEFGNQLYEEGDFQNALIVYQSLAQANRSPSWQIPALYQVGLVYERLKQPQQAAEIYQQITDRATTAEVENNPAVKTVLDMVHWRKNNLAWQTQAEQANQAIHPAPVRH